MIYLTTLLVKEKSKRPELLLPGVAVHIPKLNWSYYASALSRQLLAAITLL
jgi:hypothetical protein